VYFVKHKNETFSTFKEWKLLIENQTDKKIKRLRTNNGLEFCSNEFNDFCKKEGISRHLTIPSTPQQNGVAERMNRTILKRVRCMLSHSGLSKSFWAEAASTTCYLINRSPNRSIDCNIPEEVWSGDQEDAREKVEFEIKTPAHEEDVPNPSSTQDDQVTAIDGTSEHLSPHEQCPPKRRGLPQPWSMA